MKKILAAAFSVLLTLAASTDAAAQATKNPPDVTIDNAAGNAILPERLRGRRR